MSKAQPLIIAFVADLIFGSRIEAAARHLGYAVEWAPNAADYGTAELEDAPGEPVRGGQTATLTLALTQKQPALLIFDLTNPAIPWERWIAVLKSSPATRRLPVLCFGPHVEGEALERARLVGADGVATRGRFSEKLPELIAQYARQPDYAGIAAACAEPLSETARRGIALFNSGEFYEAHHGLEAAWNEDQGPARDLYRGILQVAVAYLQVERGNYRGALKMFLRLQQWLDPLPDSCRGVDITQLRQDAAAVHAALLALGPERIAEFDRSLFKPVVLRNAET